jgi:hypothetical protein
MYAGRNDVIAKEMTDPLVFHNLECFLETKPWPNRKDVELYRIFRRRLRNHIVAAVPDAESSTARMTQLEYGFLMEFMRAKNVRIPSGMRNRIDAMRPFLLNLKNSEGHHDLDHRWIHTMVDEGWEEHKDVFMAKHAMRRWKEAEEAVIPTDEDFVARGRVEGKAVRQRRPWRLEEVDEVAKHAHRLLKVTPRRGRAHWGVWRAVFNASALLRERGRTSQDIANKMSRLKRERDNATLRQLVAELNREGRQRLGESEEASDDTADEPFTSAEDSSTDSESEEDISESNDEGDGEQSGEEKEAVIDLTGSGDEAATAVDVNQSPIFLDLDDDSDREEGSVSSKRMRKSPTGGV